MKNIFILSFFTLLLSSCATHIGMVSSNTVYNNIRYDDIAFGVAQTSKLFGIGGTSKDALVFEAKKEMIKNNLLKSGQQYINYTVDFKNSLYFVYFQTKVTVSADIISSKENTNDLIYSEKYMNKLSQNSLANSLYEIGDSVLFNNLKEATIISFIDHKHVRLLYQEKNGKTKSFRHKINDIYTAKKEYNGIKSNTIVSFTNKDNIEVKGRVIALGQKNIIVKTHGNTIQYVDFSQILNK